ncbi:MAG: hypothetical protein GF308_09730 [Candidatus Heimdallarchaeota archaeon]|nr:hypothetical protein [Candidatus Heimdallarchaeota archaeon]
MNSKKISTIFVLLSIILVSTFINARIISINGLPAENNLERKINQTSPINISKNILTINGTTDYYRTTVNNTFSVVIEINNNATEAIYNVTVNNPEQNVSQMNPLYQMEWFTITGELEKNWSSIGVGETVNYTLDITPHHAYNYTFTGTTVYYSWENGTQEESTSNAIIFEVYEEGPSLKVEKEVRVSGEEEFSTEGRLPIEGNMTIRITITNYYYEPVNVTMIDSNPNATAFSYNTTQLSANVTLLKTNETFSFSYRVQALEKGNYQFDQCALNITLVNSNETIELFAGDSLSIEVYEPIYTGPDWTKRVPLITVKKYFLIDGKQNKSYMMYNNSIEPITIQINITNSGIVTAYNITLKEQLYKDWVFETSGVENWSIPSLSQGEYYLFNYTIVPQILGTFKIEPTEVTFDYINQRTLLPETNSTAYSNILEVLVVTPPVKETKSRQWWIIVGLSSGVLLLAIIPFIIAFYRYKGRKKTQKGT